MQKIKVNGKTYKKFESKKELIQYAQEIDSREAEWAFDKNGDKFLIQGLKAAWNYEDEIVIPETEKFIKAIMKKTLPQDFRKTDEDLEELIEENKDKIYDLIETILNFRIINEQEG